ncbi:MAG: hypothetical protein ACREFP_19285 [Acetobacteraceae bacterium]
MVDETKWTCSVDPTSKTATLKVSRNGGTPYATTIRGVCYSPAPINGSNKYAPALGDWYWDDFGSITGWKALWQRDLPSMRMGGNANAVRIYCSLSRQLGPDGSFPVPWNGGQLFTHQTFLDWCWNGKAPPLDQHPMYVLVGVPLPSTMLWKNQYDKASEAERDYWTNVLRETVAQVGRHPAVMGFTIQNEQDAAEVCYGNPTLAAFWWGQVEKMAAIVKSAAPDKLVGMATHDDPQIPAKAASYMANCRHIDFWGVNTYQTLSFDSVFSGYAKLTGSALKPVILTEYGLPPTGHRDPGNPATIYEDASTRTKTAGVLTKMLPQAFKNPLGLGVYYFEFCDEWWNQPEAPNIYTWYGGPAAPGFPNGYWDNDGFGLSSIKRGGSLPNDAPIWTGNGPNSPIDVHTQRTEVATKVWLAYEHAPRS